ncbi:39S ribosomal protein L16-like isoform X2 [Leptotrombidium deliense]|uniref:Large ribosomal subunit protein uL16m n=1 Tax=Leptotrombidium deliense TaxID=299467 RepID=A0A443S5W2_9ACAR|nr:39S ribosomal protein L16-like isoform X2 [Leptotrombidium deliense]
MILRKNLISVLYLPKRGMRELMFPMPELPNFDNVVVPENYKLPQLDPVPSPPNQTKVMKRPKKIEDIRGPELVHNRLLYKQYGIMALTGGFLFPSHINHIRNTINRYLKEEKSFAVWRIDAPWKPMTKKGIGKTLGGGKGNIYAYSTPVRAGRVLVEVGGKVEFEEVYRFLNSVCVTMPCMAIPVSEELIKQIEEEGRIRRENNINPLSYDFMYKNNIRGIQAMVTPYAAEWKGDFD